MTVSEVCEKAKSVQSEILIWRYWVVEQGSNLVRYFVSIQGRVLLTSNSMSWIIQTQGKCQTLIVKSGFYQFPLLRELFNGYFFSCLLYIIMPVYATLIYKTPPQNLPLVWRKCLSQCLSHRCNGRLNLHISSWTIVWIKTDILLPKL